MKRTMRLFPLDTRLTMRLVVCLFFSVYLIAGVLIHAQYGASWDEPLNRDLGQRTLHYITSYLGGHPVPWKVAAQGLVAEQGPFFEAVLAGLESVFGLQDMHDILLMRHLATFLVCWLGSLAFYDLLRICSVEAGWALCGTALLVLSPRQFAHSFYNSKDAVLAALIIIALVTMLRFVRRPTAARAGLHALACAAAIAVRAVALLLPGLTCMALCLHLAGQPLNRPTARKTVISAAVFLALCALSVLVLWPALWEHPLRSLLETLRALSSARQMDNNYSLYLGSFVGVDKLPWHYLPVWMLITIPLGHLLLIATGLLGSGWDLLRRPLTGWPSLTKLVLLLTAAVPVLAVVLVRPVLYDDWRHLYFVYPPLVALAICGLQPALRSLRANTAVAVLTVVALLDGGYSIVRLHPYQNVYFNALAGHDPDSRFELDYWGLSFRQGLEYVLQNDPREKIRVSVSDYPGVVNWWMLKPEQRERLMLVPLGQADWFLSNHRQPEAHEAFRTGKYPCSDLRYAVRCNGATLLGVYRLP